MKSLNHIKILTVAVLVSLMYCTYSQPYYVSTTGNDNNTGTIDNPFATIEKAIGEAEPGETIYVRGGTYQLVTTINISKDGAENAKISLISYPGERAILDFSDQAFGGRGIKLTGDYWHIKGIDITGAGDNGMKIEGGSNNIIEHCAFYRNRDSGMQLDKGAANNKIINCDSYFNADPTDYGDADGFAPKMDVGSGNWFYGCRAWKNCDDGWDGYLRGTDDVTNSAENCWAFENGYLENGTDPGSQANGNGFKMGGSDDKTLKHNFTLKNCLAFSNKAKGFDQNNNKGSMTLYNCTGHANLTANFRISQELAAGKVLIVKNCASFNGSAEIGSFAQQDKNSWLSPFTVTESDFISLDETAAYGPRKADGSLPSINYMHLVAGSDLIDAGVDVGLPYAGALPDLGCFETGLTTFTRDHSLSVNITCYPNPAKNSVSLRFNNVVTGKAKAELYDISGRLIQSYTNNTFISGEREISLDLSDIKPGIYFITLKTGQTTLAVTKIVKQE
ncbi:MAG: right-handed parallel beta-helix repeat-containing protein [Bacteroidales bacterium]|nr:right-handed parallel beta-helix repeat-containing protein [Bacteroidales bacterium]